MTSHIFRSAGSRHPAHTNARLSLIALAAGLAAGMAGVPAQAQDAGGDSGVAVDPSSGEIVVTAPRLPGQVETDVPPVLELDEEDIEAYGVGSIEELVEALEPASGSSRGRGATTTISPVSGSTDAASPVSCAMAGMEADAMASRGSMEIRVLRGIRQPFAIVAPPAAPAGRGTVG